jgi:ADP-heptose:LPS heptosyltransferase
MTITDGHTNAKSEGGVLVVNYPGIGDAILAYPLILSLARSPRFEHSIIAHPNVGLYEDPAIRSIFSTPANLQVFDPTWYLFATQQWTEIVSQARAWDVRVILNMQNEGPLYDFGYYRFKRAYEKSFEFWEINFDDLYSRIERRHVLDDVRTLLTKKGVSWYSPKIHTTRFHETNRVAVFVGSSEPNKRWGVQNWSDLLERLARGFPFVHFVVLAGSTQEEIDEVFFMSKSLGHCKNVDFPGRLSLYDTLRWLGSSQILISHDSYPIHYAAITRTPAVGIYLSTDPIVWGSYENPTFAFVTSKEKCDGVKCGTGNCLHFHTACPNIQSIRASVTVNQVASLCETVISRIGQ